MWFYQSILLFCREKSSCPGLSLVLQAILISLDGFFETHIKRVGNQAMPNRHLVEIAHILLEIGKILEAQIVTSIHAQTAVVSRFGCCSIRRDGFGRVFLIFNSIRTGVKLNAVGAQCARR